MERFRAWYGFAGLLLLALTIAGCSGSGDNQEKAGPAEYKTPPQQEKKKDDRQAIDHSEARKGEEKQVPDEGKEMAPEQKNNETSVPGNRPEQALAKYSSEEIEYARVWLQLGANQDLKALEVTHIPAGTPLNPDDGTNVGYPEDVIQLQGSRLVDGIVTYSGNGDGTINVYNVPARWYGGFPPPDDVDKNKVREDMKHIINHPKRMYIDPGNEQKIIKLISIMEIR